MFRRRDMLAGIAATALAGPLTLEAAQTVHEAATEPQRPKALTQHEFDTLKTLCELIVPGANKGGAAEFIDLLSSQNPQMLEIYTGGLAWIDFAIKRDSGGNFLSATAEQRTALLDKIAWRRNETPALAAGIRFFDFARRMTVDAYYTSAAGIKELGYMGNKGVKDFSVPAEAVAHALGKSGLA
jgi:gluconate 2-dehydrogenase gamma chain